MDLSSIQPMWYVPPEARSTNVSVLTQHVRNRIPETLRFLIADFESEWTLGKDTFDLIHLRIGTGSISSYPALFQRVYQFVYILPGDRPAGCANYNPRHLRPGCGWFEYVDIDMVATSDDGTLTPQHAVSQWQELLLEASSRTGKPLRLDHNAVLSQLHNCGFTDIQSHVIKLPLNPWPASHAAKELGRWYNLGMSEGLEALTLGPLCRVEGWTKTRVNELLARVQKELSSKSIHGYHKLSVPQPTDITPHYHQHELTLWNNRHIYIARRPDGHPSHR